MSTDNVDTLGVTAGGSVTATGANPYVSGPASLQDLLSALTVRGLPQYSGAGIKIGVLSTSSTTSAAGRWTWRMAPCHRRLRSPC
jgi:hypothetical protein